MSKITRVYIGTYIAALVMSTSLNIVGYAQVLPSKKIHLKIMYLNCKLTDTLTISTGPSVISYFSSPNGELRKKVYRQVVKADGYYHFDIPVEQSSGYFELTKNKEHHKNTLENYIPMLEPQFWEAGDSLNVKLNFTENNMGADAVCEFSGHGALKYNLLNQFKHIRLDSGGAMNVSENRFEHWDGNLLTRDDIDATPTVVITKLALLKRSRLQLSEESYNVLQADLIYSNLLGTVGMINHFVSSGNFKLLDSVNKVDFITKYNSLFDPIRNYGIQDKHLTKSLHYIIFESKRINTLALLRVGEYSPEAVYQEIKNAQLNPELKEMIMMKDLLFSMHSTENLEFYYKDVKSLIKTPMYLAALSNLRVRQPGQKFIDFKLEDTEGNFIKLSDFKNKVVFIDFWYTGCGNCAGYFRRVLSQVEKPLAENKSVIFISISIDRNKSLWKNSVQEGIYTSAHTTNLFTNGLSVSHELIKHYNIPAYPFVVLLDKEGKIKYLNSNKLYEKASLIGAIRDLL